MECDGHGLRGRADLFFKEHFQEHSQRTHARLLADGRHAGERAEHRPVRCIRVAAGDGRRTRSARATSGPGPAQRIGAAQCEPAVRSTGQPFGTVQPEPQALVGTAARVNAGTNGFVASRASGATKTDSPIMSTPASIAVITRDEMNVRHAQSIRDLLRYAPGIYFSNDTDFRFQQRQRARLQPRNISGRAAPAGRTVRRAARRSLFARARRGDHRTGIDSLRRRLARRHPQPRQQASD